MLTVKQYEDVLKVMGPKKVDVLKKLYLYGPFDNSITIARTLSLKGFGETNLRIGTIGKYISEVLGLHLHILTPAVV